MSTKCKKCGKPMEMYYNLWCPRCDKPKVETVKTLNLIKVLRYIEVHYNIKGFKNRVWKHLIDVYSFSNDSSFTLYFPEESDKEEYELEQIYNDLLFIKETFNLNDSIVMEVSW